MSFNPFEANTSLIGGVNGMPMAAMSGMGMGDGVGMMGGNTHLLGGDGVAGGMGSVELIGDDGPDFWSWLSSEGQSFSPLVNTLDTFDSSLAMGGI